MSHKMAHERRRSTVHDLVNDSATDTSRMLPSPKTRHVPFAGHGLMIGTASSARVLPPIDTPDKCRQILGCQDPHPKETHQFRPVNGRCEPGSQYPSLHMTSQQRDDARYYPSPDSDYPPAFNKTEIRGSNSGLHDSGLEPTSCDSSIPRDSFSRMVHLHKTGPNALGSISSESQTSNSRHSSHQHDWTFNSPNKEEAVTRTKYSDDWSRRSDYFGNAQSFHLAGPARRPSPQENIAAMMLTRMSGAEASDNRQGSSAGNGRGTYFPTEAHCTGRTSQLYQGGRLPSIRPVSDSHTFHASAQRGSLQSTGPFFRNPFYSASADTNPKSPSRLAQLTLPPLNSGHSAFDKMQGTKRRAIDDENGETRYLELPRAKPVVECASRNPLVVRYGPIYASEGQRDETVSADDGRGPPKFTAPYVRPSSAGSDISPTARPVLAHTTSVIEPTHAEIDPESEVEDDTSNSQQQGARNFFCCYEGGCDTMGDNPRKAHSDFFGRNKTCTTQIPKDAWNMHCRQHYQRIKYRCQKLGKFSSAKALSLERQLKKFDRYMGAEKYPQHGPIVYTIEYQRGLRKAVNDAQIRRAKALPATKPTGDQEINLTHEVNIALAMDRLCGENKNSTDCIQFVREMIKRCEEVDIDLLRVEFLPVEWGGKQRMKPTAPH